MEILHKSVRRNSDVHGKVGCQAQSFSLREFILLFVNKQMTV